MSASLSKKIYCNFFITKKQEWVKTSLSLTKRQEQEQESCSLTVMLIEAGGSTISLLAGRGFWITIFFLRGT